MAKAQEIEGLECAADAKVWATQVLRARFDEIFEKRGAVLESDDIEAVHDMRVATRRLRSAMRDFAPVLRKKPLKKASKELKILADALGGARDEDVAIVALEKMRKKAPDETLRTGINRLIAERRERRAAAQLDLSEKLAAGSIEELSKRFHDALDNAAASKKNKRQPTSFSEAGRDVIEAGLKEFCDLSDSLYAPFEVEKLHKLRIVAKRLRYAIELFTACWGDQIAPFAEEVASMQSFLGEVHDADIWIEDFSERLTDGGDGLAQTNLWLLEKFVQLRTKNYCGAIELWRKWEAENFIEKLRGLIATPAQEKSAAEAA